MRKGLVAKRHSLRLIGIVGVGLLEASIAQAKPVNLMELT